MNQSKRLIVMAGGTGGHVFPGISVARYLISQGWHIRWLGTTNRLEASIVPKYGIEIDFIRVTGIRGKRLSVLLQSPVHILKALCQARAIMNRFKPDVVLGMGSYVSGPGGLAAWSLGIPVILHEQNNVVGLTNKWLATIATKIMQAFPGVISGAKVVGNPIRTNILNLPPPHKRLINRNGPLRVLVVGGSQGAYILNQVIPQVAAKLSNSITICHQSGRGAQQIVEKAYTSLGQSQHKVIEFIDDMAASYSWADVVICRSGALTVSEIAAVGLPAMFVPFQHKDRQQYLNALLLEKAGAAKIFEQSQFTANAISTTLARWDRQKLLEMAERARAVAVPDSTERVANEVIMTLEDKSVQQVSRFVPNFWRNLKIKSQYRS